MRNDYERIKAEVDSIVHVAQEYASPDEPGQAPDMFRTLQKIAFWIGDAVRMAVASEGESKAALKYEAREVLRELYRGFRGDDAPDEVAGELLRMLQDQAAKDENDWSGEEAA